MEETLAALNSLGPYFAVERRVAAHDARPLVELLEPGPLELRVAATGRALGLAGDTADDVRVAASTVALGLFSRLVSPVLGAAAAGVPVPAIALASTWWSPVDAGPWPLAVEALSDADDPLAAVLTDPIAPLIARFADGFAVSRAVLWGNAASAVFGAVTVLRGMRADEAGTAIRLALAALRREPLREHGRLDAGRFVRNSCCLYYRVPGGDYCGDCVLAHR